MIAFVEVDGVGVALFKSAEGIKLTVSGSKEFIKKIPLTQYHQDMMNEVVEKIETLKVPLEECGRCNACEVAMHCTTAEAHLRANQVLTEAQTIIKSVSSMQLKSAEELAFEVVSTTGDPTGLHNKVIKTITNDRLAISNALVEALEEAKKDIFSDVDEQDYNQALTEAQNIIQNILNPPV